MLEPVAHVILELPCCLPLEVVLGLAVSVLVLPVHLGMFETTATN